jgi:hypothetical protein
MKATRTNNNHRKDLPDPPDPPDGEPNPRIISFRFTDDKFKIF